jgi:hypothetical protein
LLLDIGVAQGELERGELMPVDAYTTGEEYAGWSGEHLGLAPVTGN